MNAAALQFWQRYLASQPDDLANAKVYASIAGDKRNADELLQLFLDGKKTAGSSLVRDYEMAGDSLPIPGTFWIILDSHELPRCIVKTVKVETYIFNQVPLKVAVAEGEGDLSLEYWHKTHSEFFEPYLAKLGIDNLAQAKIITEFFKVVFKA